GIPAINSPRYKRSRRMSSLAWTSLVLGLALGQDPGANPKASPLQADLVLQNSKIWTVNPGQPEAEAVAVWRGRIVAVGSNNDVKALIGPATRVLDGKGRRVVPGFYDSHVHLLASGMRLGEVALKDAKDEAEFGRRLR